MNRRLFRIVSLAAVCALTIGACSDATSPAPGGNSLGLAYIRIVNALFQGSSDASAVPVAIDYMINSSTESPGVTNLAANSMTVGDSANGYSSISPGLITFSGRANGDTRLFYTADGTNKPFFPKVRLTAGRYHTVLVTGRIPPTGDIPAGSVAFNLLDDDNFPGATIDGEVQARIILVNAAQYAGDSFLRYYLTPAPGAVPANLLTAVNPTGYYAYYGCAFGCVYKDVKPGTYTLTVAQQFGSTILGQQQVTFGEGDVVMAVLQSTSYSATPDTNNHILRIIHDHPHP